MKLFGGTKSSRHNGDAVYDVTSEETLEVMEAEQPVIEDTADPAVEPGLSEEIDVSVIEFFTVEEAAEAAAPEQNDDMRDLGQEDGLISSITEAFGITPEEMQRKSEETAAVAAEAAVGEETAADVKKLSRKERKAAKKAEKKAAKAAKKAAKKWSPAKKLITAAVVALSLGITAFAGYFVSEMWVTDETLDIYQADFTGDIIRAEDAQTGEYSVYENVEAVPVDETRKEGCYTFLIAARDVASGCTDVIIVGRFDTKNHTINMVSIPRDTMINKGTALKVNSVYAGDKENGGNGIDGLKREMKRMLGFEIDSYAVVDVEAVAKLIDAIGGVYFDVPIDMNYSDTAQGLEIHISKGYQKLSGADAVNVLRFRKGYPNGDLGRIETQHKFIKALAEQILDIGNIPNLGAAIEIYQEHVQTNLTAGNILFYAKNFLDMDMDNIQFVDMPQYAGGLVNGQSFIFINPSKWVNVINNYLNPYKNDIGVQNLNIKTSSDEGNTFIYTGVQ